MGHGLITHNLRYCSKTSNAKLNVWGICYIRMVNAIFNFMNWASIYREFLCMHTYLGKLPNRQQVGGTQ